MGTWEKAHQPAERLSEIRREIAETETACGRQQGSVRLIGVTKFIDTESIRPALEAGLKDVGENRAQELVEKSEFFDSFGVRKHFIGALQTNKVKYLVGKVELIQSVDREAVLYEVNRLAEKVGIVQDILIEVNIGCEEQKAGISEIGLPALLREAGELKGVRIRGLMCVPPALDEEEARPYFRRMKQLFEEMKGFECDNVRMEELSMGMSHDFHAAIEEGSTMVRIGRALFGERQHRQKV